MTDGDWLRFFIGVAVGLIIGYGFTWYEGYLIRKSMKLVREILEKRKP
jgi:hypothetical protein